MNNEQLADRLARLEDRVDRFNAEQDRKRHEAMDRLTADVGRAEVKAEEVRREMDGKVDVLRRRIDGNTLLLVGALVTLLTNLALMLMKP